LANLSRCNKQQDFLLGYFYFSGIYTKGNEETLRGIRFPPATYTHTYTHTHIYIYIHTHTHTDKQTHTPCKLPEPQPPNPPHPVPPLPSLYRLADWEKASSTGCAFFPSIRSYRVYAFPMVRGVVADPWVTCAIASFIALVSLYPGVYIHHRSLSSTVTPMRFNGCFNYCLWCLRQGYQSHGSMALTQSVPLLRLCSERQNYVLK